MKQVRALRADEIECRIARAANGKVQLLLYKDARCDMAILDETFSPCGWERTHTVVNNKEFCTVSIKDDNGEWVRKQDCGTESFTEKEKGETSDAFKRACVNWGIGRELYTKIPIWVKAETVLDGKNYRLVDKYIKFTVSKIETDETFKKILHLEISDKLGKKAFTWDNRNPPIYDDEEDEQPKPNIKREDDAPIMCKSCGKEIKPCKSKYGVVTSPSDIFRENGGLCLVCYGAQKHE